MAINIKRTEKMQLQTETALMHFVDAGTLSSAAALYELKRRGIQYIPKRPWLNPS